MSAAANPPAPPAAANPPAPPAAATPPAPPVPTKPATKAIDQEKLNRITAIFCEVLDGTNYDAAIQKAIEIENRLAQAAA